MTRKNISSGAKWEDIVGYSRAVRVGNQIEVTGTVATDGSEPATDNPYDETIYILQKIKQTLEAAGAKIEDVVRTRMFVTDISKWEEIGRAHQEVFGKIKPATTMVEVSRLIDDRFTVEIEATAIIT